MHIKKLISNLILASVGIGVSSAFAAPCTVAETKNLQSSELFEFDKSDLSANGKAALNKLAADLKSLNKLGSVSIIGHTDGKGTDAYNLALGSRRAEAVKNYLANNGIDASKLSASSQGKKQLLLVEVTEQGKDIPENRAKNRRVEVQVIGETLVASTNCAQPVAQTPSTPAAVTAAQGGLSNNAVFIGAAGLVGVIVAASNDNGSANASATATATATSTATSTSTATATSTATQ